MTVGKKITLIGAFLLSLTLILGVSTLIGLNSLVRIAHSLSEDSLAGVSACSRVESNLMLMRGDMWRHIASTDPKDTAAMDQQIQKLKETVNTELADVEKATFSDQEREIFVKIRPDLDRYYQDWNGVARLSRAGKNEEAYKLYIVEANPAFLALNETVHAETEYNRGTGNQNTAAASTIGSRTIWLTCVVLVYRC